MRTLTKAQTEIFEKAEALLALTSDYVYNTDYNIEDDNVVCMYDLDNRLDIYLADIENETGSIEESIDMLEGFLSQIPFVKQMII